jgi:hypothetical protein
MDATRQNFGWLRLPGAIFVAFISSLVGFIIYIYTGFLGPYIENVFIGFTGVFFGTFCFRKRDRLLGSIILLVGGVLLDGMFEDSDDKIYPLSVCWVALGGIIAVACHFCFKVLKWKSPPPVYNH